MHGLDRKREMRGGRVPDGVVIHEADILLEDIYPFFSGMDAVFHLAAKSSVPDCENDPVDAVAVNVLGSVRVFEAAKRARVRKVIYAESAALYEGVAKLPSSEDTIRPEGFYATSKFAQRIFSEAYARNSKMVFTALRYFNVYGPGQGSQSFISGLITKLLKGERPVIYGNGARRRDFIHIDDINDFHVRCIEDNRTDNNTYNLGNGTNYSIVEVCEKACDIMGVRFNPIFQDRSEERERDTLADITEAKKLGWAPKIDLDTGLRDTIKWKRDLFSVS